MDLVACCGFDRYCYAFKFALLIRNFVKLHAQVKYNQAVSVTCWICHSSRVEGNVTCNRALVVIILAVVIFSINTVCYLQIRAQYVGTVACERVDIKSFEIAFLFENTSVAR